MAIPSEAINYWAVLVAALIHMAIGAYWYSQSGFGKTWLKLSGFKMGKMDAAAKKKMNRGYIMAFISALVLNCVLATVVKVFTATTFWEGAYVGFFIWFGFLLTSMLGIVLWEGKPVKLYLLNVFYYLVSMAITGGILAVWN